jgi:hypothetical protein
LKGPDGTIIGISVVSEEITDRKRAGAALREHWNSVSTRRRKSESKSGMSAKTCS